MSSQKLNVALLGATGKIGKEIAHSLSQLPSIHLRILARPESKSPIPLPEGSYELIKVELTDVEALTNALKGIHTVISALNGGPETYLNLQQNLLQASINAGVSRFAPTTFGANVGPLRPGDLAIYDLQRIVDQELERHEAAGVIKPLWFAVGFFLDLVLFLFIKAGDGQPTLEYWGSGEDPFHVTSTVDIGRFVAAVVADPQSSGWFTVGAEVTSFLKLAEVYEELSGRRVGRVRKGSLEDLGLKIAELKKDQALWFPTLLHQFHDIVPKGALDSSKNQNGLLGEGYRFQSFKEAYAGKL